MITTSIYLCLIFFQIIAIGAAHGLHDSQMKIFNITQVLARCEPQDHLGNQLNVEMSSTDKSLGVRLGIGISKITPGNSEAHP